MYSNIVEPVDRGVLEENYVDDHDSCPTKQTEPGMHTYQYLSILRVILASAADDNVCRQSDDG
jgi:hypothetical protein